MVYALSFVVICSPLFYAVLLSSSLSRRTKLIASVVAAFILFMLPTVVLLFDPRFMS